MKKKFLFVFGTRPEAIKLAPLILKMKQNINYEVKVCLTGQHAEMISHVLDFFGIIPDFDLGLMKVNQSLGDITSGVLQGLEKIFKIDFTPDFTIVQGDTTSTFAGALASFYANIRIIHVEAGLRSFVKNLPYPEEMNRKLVSSLADFHFVPTENCITNLTSERVDPKKIFNVGNTVIDSLIFCLNKINEQGKSTYNSYFNFLNTDRKLILFTAHRRENFGEPIANICNAIKTILEKNEDCEIAFLLHLNPNSRVPIVNALSNIHRVHLIEHLEYPKLVHLINLSYFIVTDSGGLQEEAAKLDKPLLILRDVTERVEGVNSGAAKIVGTSYESISDTCERLLNDNEMYQLMAMATNPYGDGDTCEQIISILDTVSQLEESVQVGSLDNEVVN